MSAPQLGNGLSPRPGPWNQYCRLLTIPAELRLIIYGHLPVRTRHAHILKKVGDDGKVSEEGSIQIVIKSVPGALLATCRLIYREASPIFQPKISELRADHPRMITSIDALRKRTVLTGILNGISTWMAMLRRYGQELTFAQQADAFIKVMDEWNYLKPLQLNPTELNDVLIYIRKSAHQLVYLATQGRRRYQYLELLISPTNENGRLISEYLGWDCRLLRYGLRITERGAKQHQPLLFSSTPGRAVEYTLRNFSDTWRIPTHEDDVLGDLDMDTTRVDQGTGIGKMYRTTLKEYMGVTDNEAWDKYWAESVLYM